MSEGIFKGIVYQHVSQNVDFTAANTSSVANVFLEHRFVYILKLNMFFFVECWREFRDFQQMLMSWLCWELCKYVDNLEDDVWGSCSLSWLFTSSCSCCRKIWTIPRFRYLKTLICSFQSIIFSGQFRAGWSRCREGRCSFSCWCCREIWTIPSSRYFKDLLA